MDPMAGSRAELESFGESALAWSVKFSKDERSLLRAYAAARRGRAACSLPRAGRATGLAGTQHRLLGPQLNAAQLGFGISLKRIFVAHVVLDSIANSV